MEKILLGVKARSLIAEGIGAIVKFSVIPNLVGEKNR